MKVKKFMGSDERRILTGMIVDPIVLGRIASKFDKDLFHNPWCNQIAGWCVRYHRKYNKAPGKTIQALFQSWSEKHDNQDISDAVEKFLDSLSSDYSGLTEQSNSDYTIDIAERYFNKVKLQRLVDKLENELESGNEDRAMQHITDFHGIGIGTGAIETLMSPEEFKEAFQYDQDPLIRYPGALGRFFGTMLERDGFISFMGPEKSGKSFMLLDLGYRSMLQRKKVAFFEAGDLSKNQLKRRFMARAARRPIRAQKFNYPLSMEKEGAKRVVTSEEREFDKGLSWRAAYKAWDTQVRRKVKSKESYIRISCHASGTLSIDGMRSIIASWDREGWTPDVVIVDYADLLAPNPGVREKIDQIDQIWKDLRSISQVQHCLVATATQVKASAYNTKILGKEHFSGNHLKLAHVTGMVGINVTGDDRKQGIMRLNWVVRREGQYDERHAVHLASCLAISNPAVRSMF